MPFVPQGAARILSCAAILFFLLHSTSPAPAQSAPVSPDRPWHSPREQIIEGDAKTLRTYRFSIDPSRTYLLGDPIDLAEAQNPQTRLAWERARAQAAALGVARSELYLTLVVLALSQLNRAEVLFGTTFWSQTVQVFQAAMELNYNVVGFSARSGRIAAARTEVFATNFGFNDAHRHVVYQVEQACYRLLNASG